MQESQMKQNETPKRLSKKKLTDKLVGLIFNGQTNMTENAETLGIGRTTAYRYWNQWVTSEESQQIDVEWWANYQHLKRKAPIKAFEGLTRLKTRKMPHKIEAKGEIKEQVDVRVEHIDWALTEYAKIIGEAAELNLRAHNTQKQMDTLEKPPRNRQSIQVTS